VTILLIDDRDGFGRLLRGYLTQLGAEPRVISSEAFAALDPTAGDVSGVLIASRPGVGGGAGVGPWAARGVPVLGIGHGMHTIAAEFGAELLATAEAMHGKTTTIEHDGSGVFADLPSPMQVTCYHSFVIAEATIAGDLAVTARSSAGEVMALRHSALPLHAVQFHPEAVLSEHGYQLLGNWLVLTGRADAARRGAGLAPLIGP